MGFGAAVVVQGDFNEDGKADLATTLTSGVAIALGNGDGSFASAVQVALAANATPVGLVTGDFNGDGQLDLATANYGTKAVSVLIGSATGKFQLGSTYAVGGSPQSIVAADFNNDGKTDIATANGTTDAYDPGGYSVLLGNGNATFAASVTVGLAASAGDLVAADFDADGRTDLAVGSNASQGGVSLLAGLGNGTFAAPTSMVSGATVRGVYSLAAGDLNADGKIDLAVGGNISLYTAIAGNGAYTTTTVGYNSNSADGIAIVDLNADGKPDLATMERSRSFDWSGGSNDRGLSVRLGTGNGQFADATTTYMADAISTPAVADFDGDGSPDLAAGGNTGVSVLINNGVGGFKGTVDDAVRSYTTTGTIALADFDGDSKTDVVVGDSDFGYVNVLYDLRGTSLGTNQYAEYGYKVGSSVAKVIAADFNGDGKIDLAASTFDSTATVTVLLNGGGHGGFAASATVPVGLKPTGLIAADLNGDGKLDLATASWGDNTVSVALGNGDGTFAAVRTTSFLSGSNPFALAAGDFNGDGKPDLAVAKYSGNAVTLLLGNGTGNFTTGTSTAVGASPNSVFTGDFNGDGKLDLATCNYAQAGVVSVLLGKGNGTFAPAVNYAAGNQLFALTGGDLDGDGNTDLVVAQSYSGISYLRGLADGTFAPARRVSTGSAATVAIADIDGDGKLDLAVPDTYADRINKIFNRGVNATGATAAGGTLTLPGQTTPYTISRAGNVLTVSAAGKTDRLRIDALTTIVVSKGATVTVVGDLGPAARFGVIIDAGGSVAFNASQHLASLQINGKATVVAGGKLLRVTVLSIGASSMLDLNDGNLIVDYAAASPQAALNGYLRTGRNGGAWNGPGIASSAAAASGMMAGLGLMDAAAYKVTYGANALFAGEAVGGNALLIKYTAVADANFDGTTNFSDFLRLQAHYLGSGTFADGDFNFDGTVDFSDFLLLQANYLVGVTATPGLTVRQTPTAGMPALNLGTGVVSGYAFTDHNKNAKYDKGDGAAKAVRVFIDRDNDGVLDPDEQSVLTDANGRFAFGGLTAGTYVVRRVLPKGTVATTPSAKAVVKTGATVKNLALGAK